MTSPSTMPPRSGSAHPGRLLGAGGHADHRRDRRQLRRARRRSPGRARPRRSADPRASKNRQHVSPDRRRRPGTPRARRRSSPSPSTIVVARPDPDGADPDHRDVGRRARCQDLSDRRLRQQRRRAPPPTAAAPARAGSGRSPPGARRARAPAPRRLTSDSAVFRPPTSGTTSTLRGWSTETAETIACSDVPQDNPSTDAVAQRLVEPLGGQVAGRGLRRPRPAGRPPPGRAPDRTAPRSACSSSACPRRLLVHPDLDDALRPRRRQHPRHVGPARTRARARCRPASGRPGSTSGRP